MSSVNWSSNSDILKKTLWSNSILGVVLSIPLAAIYYWLGAVWSSLAPLAFAVAMLPLLALIRSGRTEVTAILFISALWLTNVWGVIFSGGILSPLILWFAPTTIIAGLLISHRMAVVIAGLSILASAGFFYFNSVFVQLNGLVGQEAASALMFVTLVIILSILGHVAFENFKQVQTTYENRLVIMQEQEALANEHAEMSVKLREREKVETTRLKAEAKAKEQNARENAAEFEKAAGSLADIARSVREVTKLTENVRTSSSEIKLLAEQGNAVVDRAIAQMKDIEASSAQISTILKIIEDISFQTNLLALNARVEAARAGVHGKGFAVVASEVQALAGRSSKAAQEISQLIEKKTTQVKDGVEIVLESGVALTAIADQVYISDEMIAKLASSMRHQDKATTQVSEATQRLDEKMRGDTGYELESLKAAE